MLGRQLESCAARATTPSRFRSMPRHQDAAVGHDGAHLTICALSQVAFDWMTGGPSTVLYIGASYEKSGISTSPGSNFNIHMPLRHEGKDGNGSR